MPFISMLIAALVGAAAMFFMDPNTGKRRRALLKDQSVKLKNQTQDYSEAIAKQASDKARGTAAELSKQLQKDDLSDDSLAERLRSELARHLSHPDDVNIAVASGIVTLTGKILSSEIEKFVERIKGMDGVRHVDNWLEIYDNEENISNLQGGPNPL